MHYTLFYLLVFCINIALAKIVFANSYELITCLLYILHCNQILITSLFWHYNLIKFVLILDKAVWIFNVLSDNICESFVAKACFWEDCCTIAFHGRGIVYWHTLTKAIFSTTSSFSHGSSNITTYILPLALPGFFFPFQHYHFNFI